MSVKEIRALTGLSQEEFGKKYGIPKRTIQNWEADPTKDGARACPSYVLSMLHRLVKIDFQID